MKKFIMIATVVLLAGTGLFGCSSMFKDPKTDYFYYRIENDNAVTDSKIGTRITITELTEKGKQQKLLEVPETIKGFPVTCYGRDRLGGGGHIQSSVLEILILPSTLKWFDNSPFYYCPKLKEVYINNATKALEDSGIFSGIAYVPSIAFDQYKTNTDYLSKHVVAANISFLLNYADSPNAGFYRIDNKAGGSTVTKPVDPSRDGYVFGGWYKDADCTAIWDFDNDVTATDQYDGEGGELIYNETKLYAKWNLA